MSNKSTYVFSGHQTFVLRAHWLKRIYDVLLYKPTALTDDDAVAHVNVAFLRDHDEFDGESPVGGEAR